MKLSELDSTRWGGRSELWMDPAAEAEVCDCTIAIGADGIEYSWSREGTQHHGKLALREGGADFTDTWHSSTTMACEAVVGSWALVDVLGTYSGGEGPRWGWRITLAHRPESDELVLQMTNITPWGEHGRAVRMNCKRA